LFANVCHKKYENIKFFIGKPILTNKPYRNKSIILDEIVYRCNIRSNVI